VIAIIISTAEAEARMDGADSVEVRFERRPNDGLTTACYVPRCWLLKLMKEAGLVFESGKEGQKIDFGISVPFCHYKRGRGLLFIKTKSECRLTEQQLQESQDRGSGADLFSGVSVISE
jgi:hypothetical protein